MGSSVDLDGNKTSLDNKNFFVKDITEVEYESIVKRADKLVKMVAGE